MIEDNWLKFKSSVCNLHSHRIHKITGSIGVYDAYKYIRKNKWFDIGRPLTEHEFYSIIRTINNYLAESLLNGEDISFPHRMGRLELRKYNTKVGFIKGKLKTNMPIDWDKTLRLWYDDEDSFKNRTLIRIPEKEIFRVYYNKSKALFNNKSFYSFTLNRDLKRKLKDKIKNKQIDAFNI